MDEGYITLSRRFFASKIWQAARAFNESEAWLDLIQSARFEPSAITSRIGCYEVTWNRGQYPASVKFLAKKWGRSERWVRSLLERLRRDKMITTDNSQGVTVITLVNFDKYNAAPGKPKHTACKGYPTSFLTELTALIDSRLREMLTSPVTELPDKPDKPPTQIQRKINNITTTTTTAPVCACEETPEAPPLSSYRKFLASSLKSQAWLETLAMNYHMDVPRLKDLLYDFLTDNICRGFDDKGKTLRDFKSHFNNWLLVRLRVEKEQQEKQRDNGNRQGNGAAATFEQRRDEAADLVARILARNNTQAVR